MSGRPMHRRSAELGNVADLRQHLLTDLPHLLSNAISAYRRFAVGAAPDDAKGFATHQAACRAALTHIHLLMKVAGWADGSDAEADDALDDQQLDALIREAETALGAASPEE